MKDATYTARIARHYAENVLEPDSGPEGTSSFRRFLLRLYALAASDPASLGLPEDPAVLDSPVKSKDRVFARAAVALDNLVRVLACLAAAMVSGTDGPDTIRIPDFLKRCRAAKAVRPLYTLTLLHNAGLLVLQPPMPKSKTPSAAVLFPGDPDLSSTMRLFAEKAGSGLGFAYADDRCLALPAGQTPEYTIEDVIRSLAEPQRDFARYLYAFAISLGCRSAVRVTSREHNGWKASCTLAESRRILATFHVEENAWDVKVNLPNLGDYLQQVFEDNRTSECSTMVLQVLVRSPDCRPGCAVSCAMRPEFSWEGKAYEKCARLGFYFENPNMEILPCLTELMRQEAVR